MIDERNIETMPLASGNNTSLNSGVGTHSLHLYMFSYDKEGEIDKEISMHLPLHEVEDLIKGLKRKLGQCYESRVKKI